METIELFKQYLEHLFTGHRTRARELLFDAHDRGYPPEKLLTSVIWPAMEQINRLYRENHISRMVEHMATRINRMIADQLHTVLNYRPKDGRRMLVLCGADENAELGAQIITDLFEAEGWTAWFVGSGVANDEVLHFLGQNEPDLLLIYSSLPPEVPSVRKLIGLIREVGICEDMQIMVCGGIYNRAEDLADELKADLSARNVREAILLAEENPYRVSRPDTLEPGRRRKRKRKKPTPNLQHLRQELGVEKAKAAMEVVSPTVDDPELPPVDDEDDWDPE